MVAPIDLISQAIADELQTDQETRWGVEFETIQSGGDFDLNLEDKGPPNNPQLLHVDLVAVGDEMDIESTIGVDGTKDVSHLCTYQVIVRKRLKNRDTETGRLCFPDVQELTKLVNDISVFFVGLQLATEPNCALWAESSIEMIRFPGTLRDNSQFTGIARITYSLTVRS